MAASTVGKYSVPCPEHLPYIDFDYILHCCRVVCTAGLKNNLKREKKTEIPVKVPPNPSREPEPQIVPFVPPTPTPKPQAVAPAPPPSKLAPVTHEHICESTGERRYCKTCPQIQEMRRQERSLLHVLRSKGEPHECLHDSPWKCAWNDDSISRVLQWEA